MRIQLRGARVRRAGVTAGHWNSGKGTDDIMLINERPEEGVRAAFVLPSKGGGDTQIEYIYFAKHYEAQLRVMVENDRQAALNAICNVLRSEVFALSAHERSIALKSAKEAREAILDKAMDRYRDAPYGTKREKDAEKLSKNVRSLIRAVGRKS